MNIAIIENNIIAVNTVREGLIRALMEKGYNVTVVTSGAESQMAIAKEKGFSVLDIGSSTQNIFDIIWYLFNLYRTLKHIGADVCLTFTIRPAIWGNIVTRILVIPTLTNITGIGPLFERNDIAYRGARILYGYVLKKTAKIFFQNFDDMNIFLEKGFASPDVVDRVPGSGVDFEYYSPWGEHEQNGIFNFIFISRLVRDKGINEYVAAARILKNEFPATTFSVLGPVWHQNLKDNTVTEQEIRSWVDEGIINYLGEATDVREFIAASDCLVLPSYREGLSNVLLEASSMGKPCITCDTTGCREIVEDGVTGFLCRVQDVDDLANKMRMMYQLPEKIRMEMGVKAREKVVREYDKKIVIKAYLDAIDQVLTS